MVTLLLVRHAIAEPRGEAWPDDAVRPLSKKGEERMRDIAARLMVLDETATVILSSPLMRAVATARILAAVWTPAPAVEILGPLGPGHAPATLAGALKAFDGIARVALVGHEPDLGQFAAWLTGARHPLPFKKGGVARIDVASLKGLRDGQLSWFATPKILRAGP